MDDPESLSYPMPIDTSDQDIVLVGRIRRDLVCENGISLWSAGDQVRKGAATNAVQIAEAASQCLRTAAEAIQEFNKQKTRRRTALCRMSSFFIVIEEASRLGLF